MAAALVAISCSAWEVADAWVVKAGAGIYHQLPVGQFLDKEFGNPKLSLIGSDQFSAITGTL